MRPNVTTQIQRTTGERRPSASSGIEAPAGEPVEAPVITSAYLLLELSRRLADVPNMKLTVRDWGENYQAILSTRPMRAITIIQSDTAGSPTYLDRVAKSLRTLLEQDTDPV